MTIQSVHLKNLTVFKDEPLRLCPGLNVLVGANGTGKTHVLKACYSLLKAADEAVADGTANSSEVLGQTLHRKFGAVFKTRSGEFGDLCRRQTNAEFFECEVVFDRDSSGGDRSIIFHGHDTAAHIWDTGGAQNTRSPSVFIPPREFLALYEGFSAAYANRELSFDETYNDLCVALSAGPLKGEKAAWGQRFIDLLEPLLEGAVQLKDGQFHVGDYSAHLMSEGGRKIAMLTQLVRNGGITADSTIFWDEPESGLNPRMVKTIAELLLALAREGVQIVIASHDYLLTSELSLAAEYAADETPIRFFCLNRDDESSAVTVESGATLSDLEHNPILDEFAAMYDREAALYRQATSGVTD